MLMNWKSRSLLPLVLAIALFWMPIAPAHAFVKVDGVSVRADLSILWVLAVKSSCYPVGARNRVSFTNYRFGK